MDSSPDGTIDICHQQPDFSLHSRVLAALDQYQHCGSLSQLVTAGEELLVAIQKQTAIPDLPYEKSLELLAKVVSFQRAYVEDGDDDRLLSAISFYRQIVSVDPKIRVLQPLRVLGLGDALCTLYTNTGDLSAREEAVMLLQEAISASSQIASSVRVALLVALTFASKLNPQLWTDKPLQDKVANLIEEALALACPGHHFRDMVLNEYAWVLVQLREDIHGVDFEPAITMAKEAVTLRPRGHPLRQLTLSCYANVLYSQFQLTGDEDLLAKSCNAHEEALVLRPPGHRRRACTLSFLGNILLEQYNIFGGDEKLRKISNLAEEAIAMTPSSSLECSYHLILAGEASKRQKLYSDAIHYFHQVVDGSQHDQLFVSTGLHEIGECIVALSGSEPDMRSLIEAIKFHEDALLLRPPEHAHHACSLRHLAGAKLAAYKQSTESIYLAEATELYKRALQGKHWGHPMKAIIQHDYARALLEHNIQESWHEALDHISIANTDDLQGTTQKRLQLMSTTASSIERVLQQNSTSDSQLAQKALGVYMQAVRLLPRAAHLGMSMSLRLKTLQGTEGLCRVAAIRALLLGDVAMAVECLEEGRNVFWAQALRLRSPSLDRLSRKEQNELQKLLRKLEQSLYIEELSDAGGPPGLEKLSIEQRQLNAKLQSMLNDIRSRPGFSRFMSIEPFGELAKAANSGAVVLLLATELASFAIVISSPTEFKPVELKNLSLGQLRRLRARFEDVGLQAARQSPIDNQNSEQRLGVTKMSSSSRSSSSTRLSVILDEIWKRIVHPVVLELSLEVRSGRSRPRLYWCPVGDFAQLPLHAASSIVTGTQGISISDFVVSSYIPSLSSLIKVRQDLRPIRREALHALLVTEPCAESHSPLPSAEREVEDVAKLMASAGVRATVKTSPSSHTVLEKLNDAHILHLACHGVQAPDALQSHFVLRGDKLSIAELAKLSLPNATLAFLSACETAKGDLEQPDQVVHLAASMLFCGFRSVIGTMWTMNDRDGPEMAKSVYTELLKKESFELDDVPYALDEAVQKLRKAGASPARWATFVHMGA